MSKKSVVSKTPKAVSCSGPIGLKYCRFPANHYLHVHVHVCTLSDCLTPRPEAIHDLGSCDTRLIHVYNILLCNTEFVKWGMGATMWNLEPFKAAALISMEIHYMVYVVVH